MLARCAAGASEPGGPDALAAEGLGWLGGDFGCPGQYPGEQVQQVGAFVVGEWLVRIARRPEQDSNLRPTA